MNDSVYGRIQAYRACNRWRSYVEPVPGKQELAATICLDPLFLVISGISPEESLTARDESTQSSGEGFMGTMQVEVLFKFAPPQSLNKANSSNHVVGDPFESQIVQRQKMLTSAR